MTVTLNLCPRLALSDLTSVILQLTDPQYALRSRAERDRRAASTRRELGSSRTVRIAVSLDSGAGRDHNLNLLGRLQPGQTATMLRRHLRSADTVELQLTT